MKAKGEKNVETGFKAVPDGYHMVEFQEGIDLFKDESGSPKQTDKGENQWIFKVTVNEPDEDYNGSQIQKYIVENDGGEKQIAHILANAGLEDKFNEKFPGDRSYFEPAIMAALKTKLPGTSCKVKTVQNKKGFANIVGWYERSYKPEKEEAKGDKKDAKKSTAKGEAPAEKAKGGDDWD